MSYGNLVERKLKVMPNLYLGGDVSFAKSGIAIIKVTKRVPTVELAYLITSNKDRESHIRIDDTITEIKHMASKYDVQAIVKEQSMVARASTATPVIKTHAVFEHVLSDRFRIDNIHASSIKKWARGILGKEAVDQLKIDQPKNHGKLLVGKAVEKYYGENVRELLYTPRGRYIDDIGDAIALMTLWLEEQDLIDIKR